MSHNLQNKGVILNLFKKYQPFLYLLLITPLFLIPKYSFSQNSPQKKYSKVSLTVIPIHSILLDTVQKKIKDQHLSVKNNSSLRLSEIEQYLVQTEFTAGSKFFFNKVPIISAKDLIVSKDDSLELEDLYSLKSLKQNKLYRKLSKKDKYNSVPLYSYQIDRYGSWVKQRLEKSTIPGDIMMTWTITDTLIRRAKANMDFQDIRKKTDQHSFNFYIHVLDNNYILIENLFSIENFILERKFNFNKKEKLNVKKSQLRQFELIKDNHDISINKHFSKIAKKRNIFSSEVVREKRLISKVHVFKIRLDSALINNLASYPSCFPQNVNLDFVCRINYKNLGITTSNMDGSPRKEKPLFKSKKNKYPPKFDSKKQSVDLDNLVTKKKEVFSLQSEDENQKNLKIYCEQSQIEKNETTYHDSIKSGQSQFHINDTQFTKNLESKNRNNELKVLTYQEKYSKTCKVPTDKEKVLFQDVFSKSIFIMEEKRTQFQILTPMASQKFNKLKANIDREQSIYMGQQFKLIERSIDNKGSSFDNRIGTARIIKLGSNIMKNDSSSRQTVLAQIDGRKANEYTLLIQNEIKGFIYNFGYGMRHGDNALILSINYFPKFTHINHKLSFGIGLVMNTSQVLNYHPTFISCNISREFYSTRLFHIEPYIELGHGGDFVNIVPVKRLSYAGIGLGIPINVYNRKITQKIKLMPEVFISTSTFNLQPSIRVKIEI